jgi:hypothetical protein
LSSLTLRRLDGSAGEATRCARYGDRCFSVASALPLEGGLIHPGRALALMAAAARRPQRVIALVTLLLRTRSESVFLSRSAAGRALLAYFSERSLGVFPNNRLCRGVLVLPQDRSEYLRGRHRQALRTNLRRAADAGIKCELVHRRWRVFDEAVEILLDKRPDTAWAVAEASPLRSMLSRPEVTLLAAHDRRGRSLAVAAAVIDDTVCLLEWSTSSSHEARWALHDHLVHLLIARGVRYLVASGGGAFGALGFGRSLQHYQHLLGYELRHVRPARAQPMTRRRRLVVVAAAVAVSAVSIATVAAESAAFMRAPHPLVRGSGAMRDAGSSWPRDAHGVGLGEVRLTPHPLTVNAPPALSPSAGTAADVLFIRRRRNPAK